MAYKRSDRVGDLIRKEVAEMLQRGDIKDPRIGLVTITMVKMGADLKNARVFFSQMGSPEEREESLKGLNSAAGFVRRHLARALRLKNIPTLTFAYDDSIEYSDHMSKVLKELHDH